MHHRPFDVSELNFGSNPREVMEARIVVEPPVSGLLARDANRSDLDRVQEELDAAARLIADVTALPTFVDLGMEFHARLTRMYFNRILVHVVSDLVIRSADACDGAIKPA
jgi:DNA-binding GntR family transcriptional regulator